MVSAASFVTTALIVCRTVIGLVFVWSGGGKAVDIAGFTQSITGFSLIPPRWTRLVAYLIMLAEGVTALSMVLGGRWLRIGFALALSLLIVFSVAMLIVLMRRLPIACHCFGRTARPMSLADVARNSILIMVSGGGLLLAGSARVAVPTPIVDVGWLVLLAATMVVVTLHLHDLAQLYGWTGTHTS